MRVTRKSLERIKAFRGLRERRIGLANHLAFHGFERLLGRNALEPALQREFFVVGEIEADQNADAATGGFFLLRGVLLFSGRVFLFVARMLRVLGFGLGLGLGLFRALGRFLALETEQKFFSEAGSLHPRIKLVARLLGRFFVGAETENQYRLCHAYSIAALGHACQARSAIFGNYGFSGVMVRQVFAAHAHVDLIRSAI
jgi:hypothetical protein